MRQQNLYRKIKLFSFLIFLSGCVLAQSNVIPFSTLPTFSTCDTAKDRIVGLHWNGSKYVNAIMSPSTLLASTKSSGNGSPVFFATAATTSALSTTYSSGTLTATTNGKIPLQDGIKLTIGDVLLVKNNVAQLQNGLYVIYDTGGLGFTYKMYRDSSYNQTSQIYPSQINVLKGSVNGGSFFLQTTINPIIGTDPIVYISIPAPTNAVSSVTFVDVVVNTPLTNSPVYASGAITGFPGQNATYTAATNGRFPTISGVPSFINQKILVRGQIDSTKNGDYVLVSTGSFVSPYKLQRISYTASAFYPHLWEVLQGTDKGSIYQQNSKFVTDIGIGVSDYLSFTNINPSVKTTPSLQTISSSTITPDPNYNGGYLGSISTSIVINNPTVAFSNLQSFLLMLKDNGSVRAISFGTSYVAEAGALPSSTTSSKTITLYFIYNPIDSKYHVWSSNEQ